MPWFPPAVAPPALAAAYGGGRIKKQRAGLPKLLHRLFIKVLRLRPPTTVEDYGYYGCRMGGGAAGDDEEYCYCYSYGGGSGSSSWAGVLSSIPEEDYDNDDDSSEEGTPNVVAVTPGPAAVLRKAKSERFVVGVHVEILL